MPRARLATTQTIRLQLNTRLQTALNLLRADAAGLTRYLEEQAESNPHLRLEPAPPPAPDEWLPRWSAVFGGGGGGGGDGAVDRAEAPAASLMAHVMDEIDRMTAAGRDGPGLNRDIACALAEALEPSGWLGRPLADIARDLGVPLSAVEAVLQRLQRIEPAGLFARSLAECLELQLAEAGQLDAVMQVILGRLDLLAAGDLARLARLARSTAPEIAARFRLIRALDPKPGTQFAAFAAPTLREPDLLARRLPSGEWVVSLNRSCLPSVRIVAGDGAEVGAGNHAGTGGRDPGGMAAARAVSWLLAKRNDTLLRVGREVLSRQRAALEDGPGHLVALTMAEVAEAVGVHESTVSRVVAGTAVDTPRGTWWLRRLFSVPVAGGLASGAAVQARLQRLVAAEPRDAPLSDAALAAALAQGGAEVARRTVAKYRAALGIAPAHRRRLRGPGGKPVKGA